MAEKAHEERQEKESPESRQEINFFLNLIIQNVRSTAFC
jgi:hypothetical protein